MRKLWGAGIGVLVSAASLAATSGAVALPSGDTCVAAGTGTAYTLIITLPPATPPGGSEQTGFAYGAKGVKLTNIKIPDTQGTGTISSQNLPANTTSALFLAAPAAVPGASISAALTTSGPVTGSFTVVPANSQHAFFDPVVCALPKGTPVPSNTFTMPKHFTYDSMVGTWHALVTVPGPGRLNFAAKGTSKPLVQAGKVSVRGAGKVKLTLTPTAAGKTALKATGSIKLNLSIEFSPKDGKPSNKLLNLTLKK